MNITKKDLSMSLRQEFSLSMEEASIFVDEFFLSLAKSIMRKIGGNVNQINHEGLYSKWCPEPDLNRHEVAFEGF